MKDEDILIEVARLDGWAQEEHFEPSFQDPAKMVSVGNRWVKENRIERRLPDYLNSRDAIIPVIEKHPDALPEISKLLIGNKRPTFLATAREICVALLKAAGKFREE